MLCRRAGGGAGRRGKGGGAGLQPRGGAGGGRGSLNCGASGKVRQHARWRMAGLRLLPWTERHDDDCMVCAAARLPLPGTRTCLPPGHTAGMIKHPEVAACLDARLYDCVCKFDRVARS